MRLSESLRVVQGQVARGGCLVPQGPCHVASVSIRASLIFHPALKLGQRPLPLSPVGGNTGPGLQTDKRWSGLRKIGIFKKLRLALRIEIFPV